MRRLSATRRVESGLARGGHRRVALTASRTFARRHPTRGDVHVPPRGPLAPVWGRGTPVAVRPPAPHDAPGPWRYPSTRADSVRAGVTHPHRAEEGAGYEATPRDPSAMPSAGVTRLVKNTQRAGGLLHRPLKCSGGTPSHERRLGPSPPTPRGAARAGRAVSTNAHITT